MAAGNPAQFFFPPGAAMPYFQGGVAYYPQPAPAAPGDPATQQPVYQRELETLPLFKHLFATGSRCLSTSFLCRTLNTFYNDSLVANSLKYILEFLLYRVIQS